MVDAREIPREALPEELRTLRDRYSNFELISFREAGIYIDGVLTASEIQAIATFYRERELKRCNEL